MITRHHYCSFYFFTWILLQLNWQVYCIHFLLPVGSVRCLKESVHKGDLVLGEYEVTILGEGVQMINIAVTDIKEHSLYSKDSAQKGKFVFSLDYSGPYSVCFSNVNLGTAISSALNSEISLDLSHGADAKEYEGTSEVEQLKPLELKLRRLEDLATEIMQDFTYMRKREEEMRNTNESTNSRVVYFSILSMVCLLFLACWQLIYLRRYFKAKKLIE